MAAGMKLEQPSSSAPARLTQCGAGRGWRFRVGEQEKGPTRRWGQVLKPEVVKYGRDCNGTTADFGCGIVTLASEVPYRPSFHSFTVNTTLPVASMRRKLSGSRLGRRAATASALVRAAAMASSTLVATEVSRSTGTPRLSQSIANIARPFSRRGLQPAGGLSQRPHAQLSQSRLELEASCSTERVEASRPGREAHVQAAFTINAARFIFTIG
jgi:hypothetical protein